MVGRSHGRSVRRRGGLALVVTCCVILVSGVAIPSSPVAAYTTVVYSGAGPGVPRISVIGDSVVAGIRWTNSYAPLARFNFTFDAESCRRTIAPSCRGREGYAPQTVIETMRRLHGLLGETLVVMGGYDDAGSLFAAGVDAVMAEAAAQGIFRVIWLTLRTEDVAYVSPTYASTSATFRSDNRILLQKAAQYGGALQIADWASYSAAQRSWVGSDGIHLSVSGAAAAAAYIAGMADRVLDGATITPPAAPVGYGPAAAATAPGRILAFAVGSDRQVYSLGFDGAAWSGYTSLGGIATSVPAATSLSPGTVDVFVRGADYGLWTRHFDGGSWWPWTSLGGFLRSGPAVASGWPGTVDVFAVGADRALWTTSFDGTNWLGWSSLGGVVTATPAATSARPGTLTVAARGADNALWIQSWDQLWSGWWAVGGHLTSAPAIVSRSTDTVEVFGRGGDNALWTNQYDGAWSGWFPLGGLLSSPPAAVSHLPGVAVVFARGTDDALWTQVDAGSGFGGWYSLGGILR